VIGACEIDRDEEEIEDIEKNQQEGRKLVPLIDEATAETLTTNFTTDR